MLLQPSNNSAPAAAAAAAASDSSDKRREGNNQEAASIDAAGERELTALSASDISPLEPFELEDATANSSSGEDVSHAAERLKDRGNALFKLGDTDAAAEMFTRVLKALEPTPVAGEQSDAGRDCDVVGWGLAVCRGKLRKPPMPTTTTVNSFCRGALSFRELTSSTSRVLLTSMRRPPMSDSKGLPRSDTRTVTPPEHSQTPALPRKLQPRPALSGATVFVRLEPADAAPAIRYRSGIISDVNDDGGGALSYDVIYDEAESNTDPQEEDEEDGVAADRVLGVPTSPCVWCAARLNLARCSFRRGRHAEVTRTGGKRFVSARVIPPEAWVLFFRACCRFVCLAWWVRFLAFRPSLVAFVSSSPRENGKCPKSMSRRAWQFPPRLTPAHRPTHGNPRDLRIRTSFKCSLVRTVASQVVEASTLVLVVARLTMAEKERPREERAKLRNHCLTALRMRGGSHLAQHHVGLARKDARCLWRCVLLCLSTYSKP